MPWLRKALYAVTAFVGASMLTTCFLDTFWCGSEVSSNWSTDEDACNTFASKEVFRTDWALNVVSDLSSESPRYCLGSYPHASAVFTLPFPLLYKLQLGKRQIWGLIVTFGLGIITISVSVVRFVTIEVIQAWTNVCEWAQ